MNERDFGNLVELGKQITDFDADGEAREGAMDEEQDNIMTFNMDVESEEEILDEIASDASDASDASNGDDSHAADALNAGTIMNTTAETEEDEGSLRVEDIDSFWLQRQIHEYEPDAEKSQRIAEEVLSILQSNDERGDEDRLVECIGVEHAALIQLLLANRSKIAFVTRWRRASSDAEREAIAQELLSDPSLNGPAVLKRLEGGQATRAGHARMAVWRRRARLGAGNASAVGAQREGGRRSAARGGAAGAEPGTGRAEAEGAAGSAQPGVRGGRAFDEQERAAPAGGDEPRAEARLGGNPRARRGEQVRRCGVSEQPSPGERGGDAGVVPTRI